MRTISDPKIGDVVRYRSGSTALAKLTGRHAGGWHAKQCLGGSVFISEPFFELDAEDAQTWHKNQCKQDMLHGIERSQLSFKELRAINVQRCNSAFFPLDSKDGPWWGNAMAGECGEACNVVKKIDRDGMTAERLVALAKELADVVTYADLLAARFGIDLGHAVSVKFNEVSERVGSTLKLSEEKVRV